MRVYILILSFCTAQGKTATDIEKDVQRLHTLFSELRGLLGKVKTVIPDLSTPRPSQHVNSRPVTPRDHVNRRPETRNLHVVLRNDVNRRPEARNQKVTSRNDVNRRPEARNQKVTSRNDVNRRPEARNQKVTSRNDVNRRPEARNQKVTSRNDVNRRPEARNQKVSSRNDVNRRPEARNQKVSSRNYVSKRSEIQKQRVTYDLNRRSENRNQRVTSRRSVARLKTEMHQDLYVPGRNRARKKVGRDSYTLTTTKRPTPVGRQGDELGNFGAMGAAPVYGPVTGEDATDAAGNYSDLEEAVTAAKGVHDHVDSFPEFLVLLLDTLSRKHESLIMTLKSNIYAVINQAYMDGLLTLLSPGLRERILTFAQVVHHAPVSLIQEQCSINLMKLVHRETELRNATNDIIDLMDAQYIEWDYKKMNNIIESLKKSPRDGKHPSDLIYDILVRVGLHPIYRFSDKRSRKELVDVLTQYMLSLRWLPRQKKKLHFRADEWKERSRTVSHSLNTKTKRRLQFRNVFRRNTQRVSTRRKKPVTTKSLGAGTKKFSTKRPNYNKRDSLSIRSTTKESLKLMRLRQKMYQQALLNRRGNIMRNRRKYK